MKISSLNFAYHKIGVNNCYLIQKNNNITPFVPVQSFTPCDTVSFSRKSNNKLYINDLRELPDLPCACCGKTMIPNSKVNDFLNRKIYYPAYDALRLMKAEGYFNESKASKEMKEAYAYLKNYSANSRKLSVSDILARRNVKEYRKKLTPEASAAFDEVRELSKLVAHNSKYMVDEINKLNPDFHKIEKRIFKELQRLAHAYPNETFYDILNKPDIHKYYLKNLEQKQMLVLDMIEKKSKSAPRTIRKKIYSQVHNARVVFKEESPSVLHKRGRVINSFYTELLQYKDNPVVIDVMATINQLPDSKTDIDAFMIKGAQKSSNAIVEILINRQRNTFEHVKPHHREGDNGENSIYNYIGLCGKCNGERQRTEYDIFTKVHPEMIENAQLQINKIIDYINKGILIGYDEYPQKIKKALHTESKGKIDINIDKLDLKLAKTNRILRQKEFVNKKIKEAKAHSSNKNFKT